MANTIKYREPMKDENRITLRLPVELMTKLIESAKGMKLSTYIREVLESVHK